MRLPDPKGVECSRFIGGRTSGVLTLRRARAAHHAVCTRAPVSVQARALLEPCVARGRPIMLCVRVSVQARAQHIRRERGKRAYFIPVHSLTLHLLLSTLGEPRDGYAVC